MNHEQTDPSNQDRNELKPTPSKDISKAIHDALDLAAKLSSIAGTAIAVPALLFPAWAKFLLRVGELITGSFMSLAVQGPALAVDKAELVGRIAQVPFRLLQLQQVAANRLESLRDKQVKFSDELAHAVAEAFAEAKSQDEFQRWMTSAIEKFVLEANLPPGAQPRGGRPIF